MDSAIKHLFRNDICPLGKALENNSEYHQAKASHRKVSDRFCSDLKALSPSLEQNFESLMNDYSYMCLLETEEAYRLGFSLGTALSTEALYFADQYPHTL